MGRPPKFLAEQIVDAAEQLVAEGGPAAATVPAISRRLGAPSGSIYHRFASRDLILAQLWIRTVRHAQEGFLAALAEGSIDAGVRAALHIPAWSRRHLPQARILVLHRREELAARWPGELGDDLAHLNDVISRALRNYTRARFGRTDRAQLETVTFALVDIPYAAVRRHLIAGVAPPVSVDHLVARAASTLLSDPESRW